MTEVNKPREAEGEERLPQSDIEIKKEAIHTRGKQVEKIAAPLVIDKPNPSDELVEENVDAGKLHKTYKAKTDKITEEISKSDKEKIAKASVKDIRYKTDLLTGDNSQKTDQEKALNLKDETTRRLKAFTDGQDEKAFYTLNYKQHGRDTDGRKHEYYDGLGDILLDPDITTILVQTKKGKTIRGHRGLVTSGKHTGRLGFLDEKGKYLATYTGDKFKILDNSETNLENPDELKKFMEKALKENTDRSKHQKTFEEEVRFDAEFKVRGQRFNKFTPISDEEIVKKLDAGRVEKDGQSILEYAKESCTKFGIPFSILKEVMVVESQWNPEAKYNGPVISDASGMGQFLSTTWTGFLKYCEKNNIYDEKWGPQPLNQNTKFNPYANLYATAWLMNQTKQAFSGFESMPFEEQATIYYLAHHEGVGGAKKFLKAMEEGRTPKPEVLNYAKRIAYLAAKSEGIEIATDWVTKDFENSEGKMTGTIDVASNQKVWLIGSSSVRAGAFANKASIGRIGMDGASPKDVLAILQEHWEQDGINKLKLPKKIIIVGAGFNDPDLEGYDAIINFLKSKGVSEDIVEVATVQEPSNKPDIIQFNQKLREKYGDRCADFVKIADNDHNGWHFTSNAYRKIANYLLS